MAAPTKIYLQIDPDEEYEGGITWSEDRISDSDVEYVRSDLLELCREYFEDPGSAPVTGEELYHKIVEVIGA